jgi:prevent-host-death family protein
MQFTVHKAKTNLSKLIEAALAGEEVIIAKGDKPVVMIVPVLQKKRLLGQLSHLAGTCPDFLEPMSEEELLLWEGG